MRKRRPPLRLEALEARALMTASGVQALFRSGQTFLTWAEDTAVTGESYHVYRSDQPITTANLAGATRLTQRWGPLPEGTSAYANERERDQPVQRNFIITDLGPELSDTTGLFVHTADAAGPAYYAVTTVLGGVEDTTVVPGVNATATPVAEAVATPAPVLVQQTASGRGLAFTQFMDYAHWNPTLDGYAYNYSVALPPDYDGSQAVPLMLYFQGWGGRYEVHDGNPFDWNSIWVEVDDPRQTWYYGFAAEHDFRAGGLPTTGPVVNFTEQRILQAVDEVSARFNVDADRVWGHGNSMGGSGMVALALRYPNVFAAVYAGLPMTDYRASGSAGGTDWVPDQDFKWGAVATNLPIENRGPHAAALAQYDGTGVWDWQDHRQQVQARAGDDMAFLAFAHRMQDRTIDWVPEGQPWVGALEQAHVGFSGAATPGGHVWPGFIGADPVMISGGTAGFGDFQFRKDMSFPAFADVSGAPPVPPPTSDTETYRYNTDLEWSTPWNAFGQPIVDEAGRYEITLRSTGSDQTADVTPRRLQQFVVTPGRPYNWTNLSAGDGSVVASGRVTADANGLVTVPDFAITAEGSRLRLEPAPLPPNQFPTAAFTANPGGGTAPATVNFDASASADPDGTIVSYAWAFGDGGTATGATVSHVFTAPGSYRAILTVTDDRGASATADLTLPVTAPQLDASRAYVAALYTTFLGRSASAADLDAWAAVLPAVGRAVAANLISHSPEALGRLVDGFYTQMLGRPADAAGSAFWVDQLGRGLPVTQVLAALLASAEFGARANDLIGTGNADANFVLGLYRLLLNRTGVSQQEVEFWGNAAPLLGRAAVATVFLNTAEFRSNVVRTLYGEPVLAYFPRVLRRTTTPAPEVSFWAGSTLDLMTIALVFANTSEFSPGA